MIKCLLAGEQLDSGLILCNYLSYTCSNSLITPVLRPSWDQRTQR